MLPNLRGFAPLAIALVALAGCETPTTPLGLDSPAASTPQPAPEAPGSGASAATPANGAPSDARTSVGAPAASAGGGASAGAPALAGTSPSPTPTPAAGGTPSPSPAGGLQTRFGNQSVPRIGTGPYTQGYGLIREMGLATIREGFNWKNLEPTRGQLVSWMSLVDDKVDALNEMGVAIQAMVTDTPDWASSDPRYASKTAWDAASPGRFTLPAGLDQPAFADGTDQYKPGVGANPANPFASYLYRLAERYKGKIAYYQVWNEPDFPSGDLGRGEKGSSGAQRYFTGSVQDYARMLRVAHTVVTGVDPRAKITTGGLGYEGYLDALLDSGAAKDFEMLDFHAYGTDKTTANGVLNSAWGFLGRYEALKGVMTAHGVTGKTYGVSEAGMTSDKPAEQAGYVAKVIATARALGDVETVQWAVFTNPGHLNIGVVDGATLTQKNAGYWATVFADSQFDGAVCLGAVSQAGWTGYRFRKPDGRQFGVAWADAGTVSATWPREVKQQLDSAGQVRAGAGSSLSLGTAPVYVIE